MVGRSPMFTIHRKSYSQLAELIRTKPNLVVIPLIFWPTAPRDHNQVLFQGRWKFSECSLSILLTLLSQPIFDAKIHTPFQLSNGVNMRLITLTGFIWNPLVLSRQFHWSTAVSLLLWHSGHASSTSLPYF